MADDSPTPRLTPLLSSAPVLRVLALDWARRLTAEAVNARGYHLWNRSDRCEALAMRMRALALDFERMTHADPGPDARREITARWVDAQAEGRELAIPAGEYGA